MLARLLASAAPASGETFGSSVEQELGTRRRLLLVRNESSTPLAAKQGWFDRPAAVSTALLHRAVPAALEPTALLLVSRGCRINAASSYFVVSARQERLGAEHGFRRTAPLRPLRSDCDRRRVSALCAAHTAISLCDSLTNKQASQQARASRRGFRSRREAGTIPARR